MLRPVDLFPSRGALSRVIALTAVIVATSAGVLLLEFGLAPAAAAMDSAQPRAAGGYDLSSGRAGASLSALVGLAGVAFGMVGLLRSRRQIPSGSGLTSAHVAIVAGLIGVVVGGLIASTAEGGLGAGAGFGGAILAVALGLIGMLLGGLVIARTRQRMQ